MSEPTTERLARALIEAGAPAEMVDRARAGYYDDYKSSLAFPETQLFHDARAAGLESICEGVKEGRWDATKEESDAWAASADGQEALRALMEGK